MNLPSGPEDLVDEILELRIGAPAAGGGFVAHAPDERVVFVRHAIEGELVRAIVTEVTGSYLRADAIEVLEPSTDRVTPLCAHAGPGRCGGCDYQHIGLEQQRRFKARRIEEQLSRMAGESVDVSVVAVKGDMAGYGWRTRIGYSVDASGHVGFHRYRSHDIETFEQCPIGTAAVNHLGVAKHLWPGVRSIDVSCSVDGSSRVIVLDTGKNPIDSVPMLEADLVINGRARIGRARMHYSVLGRNYSVSAGVFWQVHPGAPHLLGRAVLDAVGDVTGQRILDLYCGAGLFSALLARAAGPTGEVIGIERDHRACLDARHNTADLPQVSIIEHAVNAKVLTGLGRPPSTVVLDPSREGAGKQVMYALCQFAPNLERIVYVSCDPATFSRDLRVARDLGWSLQSIIAYDLFPMTEHVELLGVLVHSS
ncbi:MAG TPA: TRAM domain-containing protein [Acidimicrobiales bacterium]|nr:TRAM domain-containing protein [Acidimicrobiales bacterium]